MLADNGPTELRPGTHVWRTTPYGCEPSWDERRQHTIAPLLPEPASSLLLFDYRCYHRGLANRSMQPRPVAYVAFSARDGVSDAHNFPADDSLVDAARRAVAPTSMDVPDACPSTPVHAPAS